MSAWIIGVVGLIAVAAGTGAHYSRTRVQELRGQLRRVKGQLDERGHQLEKATQTLHRLAGIDALTKLANHSHFQEFLRNEWRRALREATSLSIVMVDIDHFADYNDRLGHQAGDAALNKIGEALQAVVRRPGDLVSRYGGEEFGIVLSRTDEQGAFKVAHKLCAAVEGLDIEHPDSPVSKRVTVSVGLAGATPAVESNWEELELVAAANRALAEAKQSGRNKIVTAADVNAAAS